MTTVENGKLVPTEFKAFGFQLDAYEQNRNVQSPLYEIFLDFMRRPQKSSRAFIEKYHIDSSRSGIKLVLKAATLFRRVYPESKLEKSTLGFMEKRRQQNPLSLQWLLFKKSIEYSPERIVEEVNSILNEDSFSDEKQEELGILLGAVPPEARKALEGINPRLLDLLPSSDVSDSDQPPIKSTSNIAKDASIPYDILEARAQGKLRPESIELLLSCDYRPTEGDIKRLKKGIHPKDVIPCIELLMARENLAFADLFLWARAKIPVGQKVAFLSRFLEETHIQLYYFRLEEILTSPITQYSPKDAAVIVSGSLPFYREHYYYGVRDEISDEKKVALLSQTPFTPEIFEAILRLTPTLFNVNHPVAFLRLFPKGAEERIFEAVLLSSYLAEKGLTETYIKELVYKYMVPQTTFRWAIDASCSVEILSLLSNRIGVTVYGGEKWDPDRRMMRREEILLRGGYAPSSYDLDYARKKGCSQEVLRLIEDQVKGIGK